MTWRALVFLRNDTHIMLSSKIVNNSFESYSGFRERVHDEDSTAEAAMRALRRHSCCYNNQYNLVQVGHLEYISSNGNVTHMFVYCGRILDGQCPEWAGPLHRWFPNNEIPFADLPQDHSLWFPYLLNDKLFYGKIYFKLFTAAAFRQTDLIVFKYELQEIQSFKSFYDSTNLLCTREDDFLSRCECVLV